MMIKVIARHFAERDCGDVSVFVCVLGGLGGEWVSTSSIGGEMPLISC